MDFYKFRINESINFNSLHTIDDIKWKPRLKLLSDFDIIFTKNKEINVLYNSKVITINPNEAFLALPNDSLYINPVSELKTGLSILHFSSSYFTTVPKHTVTHNQSYDAIYLKRHIKLISSQVNSILETMWDEIKYCRFGYKRKLDICVSEILFELYRCCIEDMKSENANYNYTTSNIYTKKVIDYLHNNYMNKITSKDIEKHLDLNYDYANSIFKKLTNFTIMDFLTNIRMSRAQELINTTYLPLKEISTMVGFKDYYYFSKRFKEITRESPSLYRKKGNLL